MRRRMTVFLLIPLALCGSRVVEPPALADDARTLSPGEVARIGRPATALVVVSGLANGEGSAFCVRSDGLFVTNHHVIQHAKRWMYDFSTRTQKLVAEGKVSLVLNSGQDNQKIVAARVLRSDPSWDLALLQAEDVKDFPALSIAPEEGLAETRDVVALGFPLGSILAIEKGTYPTANANKGTIRAIKKDGDVPSDIEADLSINPGNSGGPLLDNRGRVAGVIYARVEQPGKPGYSLAVPVNRLESFLSRPEIAFEPPKVTLEGREKPVEFKATLTSEFASRVPLAMELVLGAWGKGARHYPMTLGDGAYRVEAPLFAAGENRPQGVKVTLTPGLHGQPLAIAWVEDSKLSGGFDTGKFVKASSGPLRMIAEKKTEDFQLASAKKFTLSPKIIHAFFEDARRIGSPVTGMDAVLTAIKDQQPSFLIREIAELTVNEVTDDETVLCSVVARRSGRVVARTTVPMVTSGAVGPTLKAVSEGRFVKPNRVVSPVNSLRVFIPEGDPASRVEYTRYSMPTRGPTSQVVKVDDRKNAVPPGPGDPTEPGRVYQYDDVPRMVTTQFNQLPQGNTNPLYGKRGGLKISGLGPMETSILLLLADSDSLKIGEFAIQAPESFNPRGPFLVASHLQLRSLSSPTLPDGSYSGRFRVWEFEIVRGEPMRLAVDFALERKPDQPGGKPIPSISGMVRVNSRYE
jgi:hypothetical protein